MTDALTRTFVSLAFVLAMLSPSGAQLLPANHLGLKVLKLSDYTGRFGKAGWKYDRPRIGRENTPQTYVTIGRLMDSIGFEVASLQAYCAALQAGGVKFDVTYGRDSELGMPAATLTDPWGTRIRLTEGLGKVAGVTSYTYVDGYVTVDEKK